MLPQKARKHGTTFRRIGNYVTGLSPRWDSNHKILSTGGLRHRLNAVGPSGLKPEA